MPHKKKPKGARGRDAGASPAGSPAEPRRPRAARAARAEAGQKPREASPEPDGGGAESEGEQPPQKHLSFADVLVEVPNGDVGAATQLLLNDRGLTSVDSLEAMRSLRKLEVRSNHLRDVGFLEMNHALCWLALSKNRLRRIAGLQNLSALAVLDLSDNRIARVEGLEQLSGLKALIAARNRIKRVEGISPKKNSLLETLILSNNQIAECRLGGFAALKKLSLSHNQLYAFPQLTGLPALTELRLNGNRMCSISPAVQQLPRLTILDVGGNLVAEAKGLEGMRGLLWLKSLTVKGNAAAGDGTLKDLLASLKRLEILDNQRLTGEGKRRRPLRTPREAPGGEAGAARPKDDVGQRGAAGSASRRRAGQSNGGVCGDLEATQTLTEKAAPAAPLSVNGLEFRGKKTAFASDSEGEGAGEPPCGALLARGAAPVDKVRRKPKRRLADRPGASAAGAAAAGGARGKTMAKKKVKVKRCPAVVPDAVLDGPPGGAAAGAGAPRKKRRKNAAPERRGGPAAAAAAGGKKRRPRSPEGISSAASQARPARKKRRARAP